MDAKEFLGKLKRMCESYGNDCKDCPARDSGGWCTPEEAPYYWDVDNLLEMVEQWSQEHPQKKGKQNMDENKHGFEPKQEFTMGGIAWTVIQTGADWVKCITSDCVEKRAFDEENKNDFAASSLRTYLNGEFLRRLIQAGAPDRMFEYFDIDLTADDGLNDYGSDRVRIGLITCNEYRLLRGNIPAIPNRWWWTATPDSPITHYVRNVDEDGTFNDIHACNGATGVRPICVLKSEILVSYLNDKMCKKQESPRKTRLMDFLEKYPNVPLNGNGTPNLMPWSLGYCGDTSCYACKKAEGKTLAWCWNQEVQEDETD